MRVPCFEAVWNGLARDTSKEGSAKAVAEHVPVVIGQLCSEYVCSRLWGTISKSLQQMGDLDRPEKLTHCYARHSDHSRPLRTGPRMGELLKSHTYNACVCKALLPIVTISSPQQTPFCHE